MKIKIKRFHKDSKIPTYAHVGDAGMDLFCVEEFQLKPGERNSIPIGLAFEIPEGYVGLVWDKSGLSHKYGLRTLGGVIDSGYRGEVKIGLINLSDKIINFEKGHQIAQLLIQKIEHPQIEETTELSETERGEKGFGSTGK